MSNELKAVEQQRQLESSRHDAITDGLAGLMNRRGWDSVVAQEEMRAARYGSPAGIVAVDLDNLKEVNDTRGHAAGDDLLRSAAQTLSSTVRQSDIVARLGGDEFCILCVECDDQELNNVAYRIREEFCRAGNLGDSWYAMFPRSSRKSARVAWQPLTRDGGARLDRRYELYDLTEARDLNSYWSDDERSWE